VRFGEAILDAGFTTVPNLVLRHFSALGITHSEMLFAVCVWQYWWTAKDPYPALGTIAAQLGVSYRQVHRYARGLEAKGFLKVTHRNGRHGEQLTSEYDFSGLIQAVLRVVDMPYDRSDIPSPDESVTPGPDMRDRRPLTSMSDETDEDEEDEDEEDRIRIESFISDFAREMRDRAPLAASVTRAWNLYRGSELSFAEFRATMYAARETTRHSAAIDNRMAYWFTVLEREMAARRGETRRPQSR
jgi:hypothetical protein